MRSARESLDDRLVIAAQGWNGRYKAKYVPHFVMGISGEHMALETI
jgi:hypothetical protein